jgi:hypothetical protein
MIIKLYKEVALKTLNENRQKHIEEFSAQIQGWKQEMEEYGKQLAAWSNKASESVYEKDKFLERPQEPYKPVSYLASYDRLIELINANVSFIIEVDEEEYDQIVKNEFGWSHGFMASSARYNSR